MCGNMLRLNMSDQEPLARKFKYKLHNFLQNFTKKL